MKYTNKQTMYPRRKTIAWMILNIIKAAGHNGIRRKHIMQILFIVLGRDAYNTELARGWYSSYFHNNNGQYGIVPNLCEKVNGKYWVLKPTFSYKK